MKREKSIQVYNTIYNTLWHSWGSGWRLGRGGGSVTKPADVVTTFFGRCCAHISELEHTYFSRGNHESSLPRVHQGRAADTDGSGDVDGWVLLILLHFECWCFTCEQFTEAV